MNGAISSQIKSRLATGEVSAIFPPAAEGALQRTESLLGFSIPPLLRELYANVANGGFGPGYGIIGVQGGRVSNLGTLEQTYDEIVKGAKYLGLEWPLSVLPFCEWGCNIFSCINCADPRYPIIQSQECRIYAQDYTLEEFFRMWLDGIDILEVSSSSRGSAELVNPFTRKRERVSARGFKERRNAGPDANR
jgi:hypothetical protein